MDPDFPLRTNVDSGSKQFSKGHAILRNPREIVTLHAGVGGEVFPVHRDFAVHHSPLLRRVFVDDGQVYDYVVEDASAGVVQSLVNWLYTQSMDVVDMTTGVDDSADEHDAAVEADNHFHTVFPTYCELWVIAGTLYIPRLQNDVIYAIDGLMESPPYSSETYEWIYERTSKGSPLRYYILYMITCRLDFVMERLTRKSVPQEILDDLEEYKKGNIPDCCTLDVD